MRRVWLVLLVLITPILYLGMTTPSVTSASSVGESYAGWAMDAYPDLSDADFRATFARMRDAGANLVWIGHNNPAAVDPAALEVGLPFPVYAAAINPGDPQNGAALSIIAAQRRALDAARALGIKVVLPINYRSQMGDAWNAAHQDSVRRGPDGTVLNFGGEDASPYAGVFRADTRRYYEWIDQTFVGPYRDVILMLNLGDEPTGVDYSLPADSTFFAATGYHFADVGTDPQRIQQLGAFQSHVIVDFTTWAAGKWEATDPAVTVTISFDGGPGRDNQQAPAIEDIFRQAPPNFQPGWSAYPRDGKPSEAVDDSNLTGLSTLLGTLAHFSARYGRPYWLWSSGNSWGLGQASADPSSIADAMVNVRMLADVSKQAGGLLRGIAVWNYNVRHQGLYNDTGPISYNPDDLFARVSAQFAGVRQILQGRAGPGPNVLILALMRCPNASSRPRIWSTSGVSGVITSGTSCRSFARAPRRRSWEHSPVRISPEFAFWSSWRAIRRTSRPPTLPRSAPTGAAVRRSSTRSRSTEATISARNGSRRVTRPNTSSPTPTPSITSVRLALLAYPVSETVSRSSVHPN